jgi:uncharacterized repeat protein (TIGR01451 family)
MKLKLPFCSKLCASFVLISILFCNTLKAQLVQPFSVRYQTTQKGGIVFLANNALSCAANPTTAGGTCQTGTAALPPAGTYKDNDYNAVYVDIDGNASTFQSSSDSLNLASCSSISWAGLYWAADGVAAQGNANIKLKVNNGAYQTIVADQKLLNTAGYTSYHNFKDITSIVQAAGTKSRFTLADIPTNGIGASNQWGSWMIAVVYKNELEKMRQLTVFDGLASVSGSLVVDVPISGFLTPPTGPVSFEIGDYTHDGDRSLTGDQALWMGNGSGFVNIFDGLNPINDVMNSTVSNKGVLTPFRIPNLNNTAGLDADIFAPDNTAKNYLTNNQTSATLRLTTGGETYLTQTLTTAIDVYEPDIRVQKQVFDKNGNNVYMATVNPGDTLTYFITIKNIGSDTSVNSFLTDSIERNSVYVPNSIKVVVGPNTGNKTDAIGDDQASYDAASTSIKVNVGTGANAGSGGKIGNSPAGTDSTVVSFKVVATSDCFLLKCDNQINNSANVKGNGKISGNNYNVASNPLAFDANGCPIAGATTTFINVTVANCTYPADTTINICSNNIPLFTSLYTRAGYTTFKNSAFATVTSPSTAGTYYAFRTAYTGCIDTVQINVTLSNPANAGTDGSTSVCANSISAIDLFSLITGEQAGGVWTRLTGTGGTFSGSTFTPATGVTTSTFRYIVLGTAPCANDTSIATVTIKVNTTSTTNVSICPAALPYSWNGSRASAGT